MAMGPVEKATRAEVKRLPAEAQGSPLAVLACTLAVVMDGEPTSTTPAVARELRACLTEIAAVRAAAPRGDSLDQLNARRVERRRRRSG